MINWKAWDISTNHLTARDIELLQTVGLDHGGVAHNEYMTVVSVPPCSLANHVEISMPQQGYSKNALDIIRMAINQDVRFLVIDRDGPFIEGWETFDW